MNIDEVKALDNTALLDLYTLLVEYEHYDPLITPDKVVYLHKAGVKADMLAEVILARMSA